MATTWVPAGSWPRESSSVLGDALRRFHDRGGLVLGICNGFQVLVRSGLLPGGPAPCPTTLAHNDSGRFEARWVTLRARPGHSPFVSFTEPIELPVAHGEGKFLTAEPATLDRLEQQRPDRPLVYRSRRPAHSGISRQSQWLGPRHRRCVATPRAVSSD